MADEPKSVNVAKLLREMQNSEDMRHQAVDEAGLAPHLALLRVWQSQRLALTYADLQEDKHYRPACLFFLDEIYGPRDFSQRDHDVERLHAFLSRVLPAFMIRLLTESVELNRLTNALDDRLARVLVENLGVTETITPELYAEGYRICDNYAERAHQIDLIGHVIEQVNEGARSRLTGIALKAIRAPARKAGWTELYDFLESGYRAFREMRDPKPFLAAIRQREMRILDRIFASHPDPFGISS